MRLSSRSVLLTALSFMVVVVSGNTEIVNFFTSEKDDLNASIPWGGRKLALHLSVITMITLTAAPPLLTGRVRDVCNDFPIGGSCPYEYWLALPTQPHGPKTLRLSWPASYPADISLKLYSQEELVSFVREHWKGPHPGARLDPKDRTPYIYARVLAKSGGIRPPNANPSNSEPLEVPVNIIYEPLLLGVLPVSLLPTVLLIVVVAIAAAFCVRPITAFLDEIARPLRKDLPPLKED